MQHILELCVTIAILLRMLYAGLFPPVGRVFSWPMYAWATAVVATVHVSSSSINSGGCEAELNPYDVLPRGEFMVSLDQFDDYLQFVGTRYRNVRCSGWIYGLFGERSLELTNHHVATPQPS